MSHEFKVTVDESTIRTVLDEFYGKQIKMTITVIDKKFSLEAERIKRKIQGLRMEIAGLITEHGRIKYDEIC